ncbi:MAG: hypothetical protein KatS3mg078_0958 [Deltaproteobacteria bacterium]|nr:MAG: hypothetical protein KatS3mg078_0958 [Deltaproteobacteria bacterium]
MEKVFIFVLVLCIGFFVLLPLFRRYEDDNWVEDSKPSLNPLERKLRELHLEKENLYSALKEIELDYELGKLSKEDYDTLLNEYKIRAARVLKEIEETAQGWEKDKERNRVNEGGGQGGVDEIEEEILRVRRSRFSDLKCPDCGKQVRTGDVFCPFCGNRLGGYAKEASS